ncbi:MAG: hypothetical protein IT454_00375 [Planctomycetes bacterium]|nr:hypothetical protein [Planctomycetota bacterium]
MLTRIAPFVGALALVSSTLAAQTFVPSVAVSVRDTDLDGLGDGFNAAPFNGLLRQTSTLEERAIQEFDLGSLAGAWIQSATLEGAIFVNNSFDVGPRNFDFSLYAGNGVGELGDFQSVSTFVGSGSYHPPTQSSFQYSFDVTSAVQALLAGGAQHVGLKVDCTSVPNFPNVLGDASVSHLDIVLATCGAGPSFCTAGTSSNGCAASISASGTPSASAGSGFTLSVTNVEGAKQGLIFYGLNNTGFTPQAWGPSTSFLCVKPPTQRMSTLNSGGTAGQCDGAFALDWNAFVAAQPGAFGAPFAGGEHVFAQAWYRDPPSPKTTHLSDALEFVVCP